MFLEEFGSNIEAVNNGWHLGGGETLWATHIYPLGELI